MSLTFTSLTLTRERPMTGLMERLDDIPRPAWIALLVVSFILFCPIGLPLLIYLNCSLHLFSPPPPRPRAGGDVGQSFSFIGYLGSTPRRARPSRTAKA